jgi:predicted acetyltransferase
VTRLVQPSEQYRAEFLAAEHEFAQTGSGRIFDRHAALIGEFPAYVERLLAEQGQHIAEPGRVAATVLWLVDGEAYIGRVNLRHHLNPLLRRLGGHIGYEIRPSRRRQGYGSQALALALERARALGLHRVLLVCAEDNAGSRGIIEANRGVLEGIFQVRERATPVRRYWIDLRCQ